MFFFFPVSFQPYASLHKPTISISIRVFNCPFDLPADAALLYSPHCCCPAVVFLFLCENKSIPIYPTATNGPFALRIPLPVPHQVIRINKKIDCVLSERKNIWSHTAGCCLAPYPWFPPSILLVKMKKHFRHLFPGCFHLLSPGAGIRSYHNMSEEKLGLAGNLILFGHKLPPHSRTFRRGNRKIKLLWQMTHFQKQGLGCDL